MKAFKKKNIDSIEFVNLTLKRGGSPILENCSFSMPMSDVVEFEAHVGDNVSSLFQMIVGLLSHQSGQYKINGEDTTEFSPEEFRPYQLNMAYAFDDGGLISNLSIRENLLLPLRYHRPESDKRIFESRVDEYLTRFELNEFVDDRPGNVSPATRKVAVLARSFLLNPQLIILDEPVKGLSDRVLETLLEVIQLHQEKYQLRSVFSSGETLGFIEDTERVILEKTKLNRASELRDAG